MKVYEVVAELCFLGFEQSIALQVVEHFLKSFEWELETELTEEQSKQILDYGLQLLKILPLNFLQDAKGLSVVLKQLLS